MPGIEHTSIIEVMCASERLESKCVEDKSARLNLQTAHVIHGTRCLHIGKCNAQVWYPWRIER